MKKQTTQTPLDKIMSEITVTLQARAEERKRIRAILDQELDKADTALTQCEEQIERERSQIANTTGTLSAMVR